MFNKNRCYKGGNKHKFEARYNEKENPAFKSIEEASGGGTIKKYYDIKSIY